MEFWEALDIVLALAEEDMLTDELVGDDEDLKTQQAQQQEAFCIVEDYIITHSEE